MKGAFAQAEAASRAIGEPPQPGAAGPDQWLFPDAETRDLAGRIFGGLVGQGGFTRTAFNAPWEKYYVIKSKPNARALDT